MRETAMKHPTPLGRAAIYLTKKDTAVEVAVGVVAPGVATVDWDIC